MHLKYFLRLLNGKDNEAYMKNIKKIIFFIIGLIIFGLIMYLNNDWSFTNLPRPNYILKQLIKVKTFADLKRKAKIGLKMIRL